MAENRNPVSESVLQQWSEFAETQHDIRIDSGTGFSCSATQLFKDAKKNCVVQQPFPLDA